MRQRFNLVDLEAIDRRTSSRLRDWRLHLRRAIRPQTARSTKLTESLNHAQERLRANIRLFFKATCLRPCFCILGAARLLPVLVRTQRCHRGWFHSSGGLHRRAGFSALFAPGKLRVTRRTANGRPQTPHARTQTFSFFHFQGSGIAAKSRKAIQDA